MGVENMLQNRGDEHGNFKKTSIIELPRNRTQNQEPQNPASCVNVLIKIIHTGQDQKDCCLTLQPQTLMCVLYVECQNTKSTVRNLPRIKPNEQ